MSHASNQLRSRASDCRRWQEIFGLHDISTRQTRATVKAVTQKVGLQRGRETGSTDSTDDIEIDRYSVDHGVERGAKASHIVPSCLLRRRSVDAESGACRFGTQCSCVLALVPRSFFFFVSFGPQCTGCEGVRRHSVHVSCVRWSLFHSDPARRPPGARLLITKARRP